MINDDIKNGILARLEELEPEYPKYVEEVKQGFVEPAFFVHLINGEQQHELNKRYKRMLLFNVRFLPDSKSLTENSACHSMAERLYGKLRYIVWGGITYHGLRLKHEVIDSVLHFFVSFEIRIVEQLEPVPKMNKIEMEAHL